MPRSRSGELAAPEHLDRALYVTTPKAWLALLALVGMLGAVVAWAVLGEIATYVQAHGIVLSRGGTVVDAASIGGGTLARIVPSLGGSVAAGEVVAEIHDAETLERHANAVALVEERTRTLREREADAREENALLEQNTAKQRDNLDVLERTGRELVEVATERLRGNLALFEDGFVARTEIEAGEEAVDLARRNLFDVMRRRDDLVSANLRRRTDLKIRLD